MSASELYKLKYELNRAIQSNQHQDGQTSQLKQIHRQVELISHSFWTYCFCDVLLSLYLLRKGYRTNQFEMQKAAQRTILGLTVRVALTYEASRQLAAHHMLKNAKPLLFQLDTTRAGSTKQELLQRMD